MGSSRDGLSARKQRSVEVFLDEWRLEAEVPGASAAVVDPDGVLHSVGMGARDVEARAPATPDTLYPFGSVTKLVTAMAVLQSTERTDLSVADELRAYVDYWSEAPGEPITVGEVLAHSSGMPADYAGGRELLFSEEPPASPLATVEDVRRHANAGQDRRVVDDDRFMYSNRGYKILGELVEAVDGRPFEAVVEEEILAPLEMERSTVGYGDLSGIDGATTGYRIEDGVPTPTSFDLDADRLGPASAGGLLGPVTEVARLVRCLMNGGELDGARVLEAETAEAMCRPQSPEMRTVGGTRLDCGYGPRLDEFLGERLVWHSGTSPGVGRAYAGFLPERECGVTLGANAANVPIDAIGKGVLALLADRDPERVVPEIALREKLRAVAGTYEAPRGGPTVTVDPADWAYLEVTYEGGPGWEFVAFPESEDRDDYAFYTVREGGRRAPLEFRDAGAGMEMRFSVDRLDRVDAGLPES